MTAKSTFNERSPSWAGGLSPNASSRKASARAAAKPSNRATAASYPGVARLGIFVGGSTLLWAGIFAAVGKLSGG